MSGMFVKVLFEATNFKIKEDIQENSTSSCSNDLEVSLMNSRFFVHDLKTAVSVVSV